MSYANVMATLAAFGVLAGGTAIALPDGQGKGTTGGTVMEPLNLKNGWERYSDLVAKPAVGKDASGFVHLQGGITGNPAQFAFRLPQGMRPSKDMGFIVAANGPGTGSLLIEEDGRGDIDNISGDASELTFLDGVSFRGH